NIGTPSNPQFESDQDVSPNNSFFGEVDTSPPGNPSGYSAPFFVDFDGKYTLFTGSANGRLLRFDNIDDNIDGAFTLTTEQFGENVKVGVEVKPVLADINNDNVLELFIGNRRGGLNAFVSGLTISGAVSTQYVSPQSEFRIFPNPVENQLTIELMQDRTADLQINVYNAIGQLVMQEQRSGRQAVLNTSRLSAGLYIVELGVGESVSVQKFVVR
ncbi:MAG: T9SS type A sorting domain-containing protein, partial [Bacteroidota bacterium]